MNEFDKYTSWLPGFGWQAEDFKPVGEKVLAAFHDWLESGAGGASNWSLAEVNHEGWRVSVVCRLWSNKKWYKSVSAAFTITSFDSSSGCRASSNYEALSDEDPMTFSSDLLFAQPIAISVVL